MLKLITFLPDLLTHYRLHQTVQNGTTAVHFDHLKLSCVAVDRWQWRQQAACGRLCGWRRLPNEPVEQKRKSFLSGSKTLTLFTFSVLDHLELFVVTGKERANKRLLQLTHRAHTDNTNKGWEERAELEMMYERGREVSAHWTENQQLGCFSSIYCTNSIDKDVLGCYNIG